MEEAQAVARPVKAQSVVRRKNIFQEFKCLRFPQCVDESFRGKISTTDTGNVLWLEGRTSKNQWQSEIDTSSCGGSAIPEDAVIAMLMIGLKLLDEPSDSKPTASNDGKDSDPVVDLVDGEIRLTLSMCNGMYRPEYIFPLVPIGIDAVAILEAKVRDLQEANREYQQRVFLKLGCDVDVTASNLFPWRAPVYMQRCPKQFELSSDSCSIVVRLEGLYELKVTVVGNGQYQRFFEALVNDERVAAVITGETNGHMSSHHLSCILMIRSGDTLTVKSGFSSTMCGDKSGDYNNLTLLRIGSFPEWA